MEVFMDDLPVYGKTFDDCVLNLKKVLKMCIKKDLVLNCEKDLVLNWEKCHFMATSRVVLGHIIFKEGIQVDPVKNELISKLHSPTTVKEVRQFLGYAGFIEGSYRTSQKSLNLFMLYYLRMPNSYGLKHTKKLLRG